MKLFNWTDIVFLLNNGAEESYFDGGTGISVGSFDGLHQGHRVLLNTLLAESKKRNLKSGVITFKRPLPSIKHSEDYSGDISTLNQRLDLLEKLGIDFVIVVDFDESFASMMGIDFLNILHNICNMELLAEGIDFRCGYKGATDTQAIKYWAEQNRLDCVFVDSVYYREGTDEEGRISSSYIRQMIQKGFFATVKELLERPYEIDIASIRKFLKEQNEKKPSSDSKIKKSGSVQIFPPDGIYRTESETGELIRLVIKDGKIQTLPDCKFVRFV